MPTLTLLKVGGAELQEGPELEALADGITRLAKHTQLVVVHGGGPEIAQWQERLGIEPRFVEGLRVTDEASLQVAEMVLSGAVNKRLTARLVQRGVRAIGLSGVDGGLLRATRLVHPQGDLGRVGEIQSVDAAFLADLLGRGFTPVISPISLGEDGRALNVNADHAAMAIGSALGVAEAIFLTNVPGVLQDGGMVARLNADQARRMIEGGQITGGMIPKVRSALKAVEAGVAAVRITNLEGLSAGSGTSVTR
jgi:acetylglutamate kinase